MPTETKNKQKTALKLNTRYLIFAEEIEAITGISKEIVPTSGNRGSEIWDLGSGIRNVWPPGCDLLTLTGDLTFSVFFLYFLRST